MHLLDGLQHMKDQSVTSLTYTHKREDTHDVVDETRDNGPRLCLSNIDLLNVQRICVWMLLDCKCRVADIV